MIKEYIINNSMNLIEESNKYNNDQLDMIRYGLEGIYMTLTKVIVILLISLLLNLFKETIYFLIIFNILRGVAFGLHANKSIFCWISSVISFLLIPFICKTLTFNLLFYILSSIITFIIFILYAPSDTVKRPLINSKKRHIYKFLSILVALIFITLIFVINNYLIKNMLIFALILESILILPITYKIFKLPYRNYLKYKQ